MELNCYACTQVLIQKILRERSRDTPRGHTGLKHMAGQGHFRWDQQYDCVLCWNSTTCSQDTDKYLEHFKDVFEVLNTPSTTAPIGIKNFENGLASKQSGTACREVLVLSADGTFIFGFSCNLHDNAGTIILQVERPFWAVANGETGIRMKSKSAERCIAWESARVHVRPAATSADTSPAHLHRFAILFRAKPYICTRFCASTSLAGPAGKTMVVETEPVLVLLEQSAPFNGF
jgi:hypothetical protein